MVATGLHDFILVSIIARRGQARVEAQAAHVPRLTSFDTHSKPGMGRCLISDQGLGTSAGGATFLRASTALFTTSLIAGWVRMMKCIQSDFEGAWSLQSSLVTR